jgi:DNA polymerase I-like protein with 3'-5' exonuclease and polymerase domains
MRISFSLTIRAPHRLAARLSLQVHDDVVLEVDEPALARVAALVRGVLVRAGVDAGVTAPLAVRLRSGPNWHDLQDVE